MKSDDACEEFYGEIYIIQLKNQDKSNFSLSQLHNLEFWKHLNLDGWC